MISKKYDGHFAALEVESPEGQYVLIAEMLSTRGFHKVVRDEGSEHMYYRVFDVIKTPELGFGVKDLPYLKRLDLTPRRGPIRVLKQLSRARGKLGNNVPKGITKITSVDDYSGTVRLGDEVIPRFDVVETVMVDSLQEAVEQAMEWGADPNGEGAVATPAREGEFDKSRYKIKPKYDAEICYEKKVGMKASSTLKGRSPNDPSGDMISVARAPGNNPVTKRDWKKGDVVTYESFFSESGVKTFGRVRTDGSFDETCRSLPPYRQGAKKDGRKKSPVEPVPPSVQKGKKKKTSHARADPRDQPPQRPSRPRKRPTVRQTGTSRSLQSTTTARITSEKGLRWAIV